MTNSTEYELPAWDDRREQLKKRWLEQRGSWSPYWEDMLRLDPEFFEAYLNFYLASVAKGTIPTKYRELIYIAVDAVTTSLYEPGWRHHLQQAFAHGATIDEVMEVYEMIATVGIHSCNIGIPLMLEELRRSSASPTAVGAAPTDRAGES